MVNAHLWLPTFAGHFCACRPGADLPTFLFILMLIYGLHYYLIFWPGAALAELFFFRFSFGLLSSPGAHWAICLCYFIACLKPDSLFVGLIRISTLLCFNLLPGFVLIYDLLSFHLLAWSIPWFSFFSAHFRLSLFCSFMGWHYAATRDITMQKVRKIVKMCVFFLVSLDEF